MSERDVAIWVEIHAERDRQDAQWGGPQHDDCHDSEEWMIYITHQVKRAAKDVVKAEIAGIDADPDIRTRLVKIAALAVAGIESIDRRFQ